MTTGVAFSKWEAVGNDFVLLDASSLAPGTPLDRWAIALCDRHRGVGGDGLIVVDSGDGPDFGFRIFNADGSEDSMCGNGLRCAVAWRRSTGAVATSGVARTMAGQVAWEIAPGGDVCLTLPPPSFDPVAIPTTAQQTMGLNACGIEIDLVQTGSAHAVVWGETAPSNSDFLRLSPCIERDPRFPERVSVMWSWPSDAGGLSLRIWERGVGETRGCGTGACAAVVAGIRRRLVPAGDIAVVSKGGRLTVGWSGEGEPVRLSGPARRVFAGAWIGKV